MDNHILLLKKSSLKLQKENLWVHLWVKFAVLRVKSMIMEYVQKIALLRDLGIMEESVVVKIAKLTMVVAFAVMKDNLFLMEFAKIIANLWVWCMLEMESVNVQLVKEI